MMNNVEFEQTVAKALDALPVFFQEKMRNIDVLIKAWPSADELYRAGVPRGGTLLGLYSGIPLTERTHFYGAVPPDTITLYQRPIELTAGSRERIPEVVSHTVLHEVAHHFGISDERLRELGAY
jgi:predicted Zn-dependent protease with MMP-like domain